MTMGLFDNKKGGSGDSTLSESEIQKKLYGEFKKDPSKVAGGGERESAGASVFTGPKAPKVTSTKTAPDLFSLPKEPSSATQPDFQQASRETFRTVAPESRTAPVEPPKSPAFEVRSVPSEPEVRAVPREASKLPEQFAKPVFTRPAETKIKPVTAVSSTDPYARYREINDAGASAAKSSAIWKKIAVFLEKTFGGNALLTRRVLYWTTGVLVVFFLFWSVNALNVQRERSMTTKYRAPAEKPAQTTKVSVAAVSEKSVGAPSNPAPLSVPEGVSLPVARSRSAKASSEAAQPAGAAHGGRFVIQVATYPSEEYANRVVASLKASGFASFVKENVRPTGSKFYWVLIGGFRTAPEAQQQLAKFRASDASRPFSDAFVKTTD
jgi:cell division septation protein DedD